MFNEFNGNLSPFPELQTQLAATWLRLAEMVVFAKPSAVFLVRGCWNEIFMTNHDQRYQTWWCSGIWIGIHIQYLMEMKWPHINDPSLQLDGMVGGQWAWPTWFEKNRRPRFSTHSMFSMVYLRLPGQKDLKSRGAQCAKIAKWIKIPSNIFQPATWSTWRPFYELGFVLTWKTLQNFFPTVLVGLMGFRKIDGRYIDRKYYTGSGQFLCPNLINTKMTSNGDHVCCIGEINCHWSLEVWFKQLLLWTEMNPYLL